jgi:hypothetical protein
MPIQPLLDREGNVFGPEDINVLTAAFNAALAALQLVDRTDPAVLMVARRVIAIAKEGTRDPTVLRDRVVESFKTGPPNND